MAVQRYTRLTADFQFRSRRGRTLHGTEQTHSQFMWPLDRITIDARTYSQKYKSIEFFAKCLQRTRARRGGGRTLARRPRAADAAPWYLLSRTQESPNRTERCTLRLSSRWRSPRSLPSESAWQVTGGCIGGFGGGSLEHPRQWLGAQWAGLSPWECRAAQSRQATITAARGLVCLSVRRALRRHRSRAGALPRGHYGRPRLSLRVPQTTFTAARG